MADLLSVQEAQERILAVFPIKPRKEVPLLSAYRRVLAQDVLASQDLPPFTNSSMDGYAVRSADLAAASPQSPRILPISAEIPAGAQAVAPLVPGSTARIMTGAPLPNGADAVVPLEEIRIEMTSGRESIVFERPVAPGSSTRSRGMDLRAGDLVLRSGRRLRAPDVGLLASLGYSTAVVHQSPRVALFSSGDELVQPGLPIGPGQIYDSNAFVLYGLLSAEGADVIRLGTARDDPREVETLLDRALDQQVDLIITSGGVSVGAYDFVRGVIEKQGALDFWRVNMRPGKPLAFGTYKGIPLLGLPGNPVSAYVGCAVFGLPVVRKLSGLPPGERRLLHVTMAEAVESDGRESYLRVLVERTDSGLAARFPTHQGSGNLTSLSRSNALLILPIGVKSLPAGSQAVAWVPAMEAGDL